MHPYVHSSIIYNRQDLEAAQVSISGWVDKKAVVHLLNAKGISKKYSYWWKARTYNQDYSIQQGYHLKLKVKWTASQTEKAKGVYYHQTRIVTKFKRPALKRRENIYKRHMDMDRGDMDCLWAEGTGWRGQKGKIGATEIE